MSKRSIQKVKTVYRKNIPYKEILATLGVMGLGVAGYKYWPRGDKGDKKPAKTCTLEEIFEKIEKDKILEGMLKEKINNQKKISDLILKINYNYKTENKEEREKLEEELKELKKYTLEFGKKRKHRKSKKKMNKKKKSHRK